ncbi:MAG: hypothetical protein ABI949_05935 [Ilumatobacteraceae bacterium]
MRRVLVGAISVMLLSSCGAAGSQSSPQPTAAPPTTSASNPTSLATVPQSLAFSAPRVGGGTIDLADYAGKPVLLWFWAPT